MLKIRLRSVFLGVLFALSLHCTMAEDPNFELGGKPGKAIAIVEKKELKLDVDVGTEKDYFKDAGKERIFTLAIGGCSVDVKARFVNGYGALYDLTGPDKVKNLIPGLESINSNSDGGVFTGNGNSTGSTKCKVTFGEQKDGKYYVPVELSDDVPAGFKLSSTEVKMGNLPESSKPNSDGKVLNAGLIAGISAAIVGAILISSSIGGFIFYRWRKNKALKNDAGKKKNVMPKSAESILPKTEPAEQKTQNSKAPEQKESSSEPEPKKKSNEPTSKEPKPKDNKKKGLSEDKKESPNDKKKSSKEKLVEKKEKSKEESKKAVEPIEQKSEKVSDKPEEKAKEKSKEAVKQDEKKLENVEVKTADEIKTAKEYRKYGSLVLPASDDSQNSDYLKKKNKPKKSKKGKTADI